MLNVTLGIPVFNSEAYLGEVFSSILFQKEIPKQIIFIDDFSSDNSVATIKRFITENNFLNIQLITNKKNLGISGNYNLIAQKAVCKWVQILDADDYLMPDFYVYISKYLEIKDLSLIISGACSNSKVLTVLNYMFASFLPKNIPNWLPVLGSFAVRSGVVYRRDMLMRFPFIDPAFDGSDIVQLNYIRSIGKCIYLSKAKTYYRIHAKASTNQLNTKQYKNYLMGLKGVKKWSHWIDFFVRKTLSNMVRSN